MINEINAYPLSFVEGQSFSCPCGGTHSFFTKSVIHKPNAAADFIYAIKNRFGGFIKILFISDGKSYDSAGRELKEGLLREGFRLCELIYKEAPAATINNARRILNTEEDVKLVVGAGSHVLCDLLKYSAACLKLPLAFLAVYPDCGACLNPSAVMLSEGFYEIFRCPPPEVFALDAASVIGSDKEHTAACFGEVLSKYTEIFDWRFASLIGGEKHCQTVENLTRFCIDSVLAASKGIVGGVAADLNLMSEMNIRLGLMGQLLGNSRLSNGGATHLTHFFNMLFNAEKRRKRLTGETLFLSASLITKFYINSLMFAPGEMLPPPDNVKRLGAICEFLKVEEKEALKKIHPYRDAEELKVLRYKISEYQSDLLALAEEADKNLEAARVPFKRIYDDCGYWIKEHLTGEDFSLALALAPDLREKPTYLLYLKNAGALERFLHYDI